MCDTFVALNSGTADGSVIFGKNSDREPNEAQSLEYHPPASHSPGEMVECTYLSIPQVSKTNGMIISRPFWMWGAEMGINEHGVSIGNEAVFTKMPDEKQNVLTGMDLLRLGLERSKSAIQALEIITELLAEFHQGGICGYQDKQFTYHNSFIIADPQEAWVLETAGHLWAAQKITSFYAISNGLTIGENFDLAHEDLIPTARKKRWLKSGKDFHFAECYSDWFYTTFSKCHMRRNRSVEMATLGGKMDITKALVHLRDHGGNAYNPTNHFFMNHICAHSANRLSRHAAQSVSSLVTQCSKNEITAWTTGTSAPCTSLFKPIDLSNIYLPDNELPGEYYDEKALWWRHEKLHRTILEDYPNRIKVIQKEQKTFEHTFINTFPITESAEKRRVTEYAFRQGNELIGEWLLQCKDIPIQSHHHGLYRRYWKKQNRAARINI
ncbi:MAG: C69 family dipeptidase [Fidelibacterota bacterium]